MYREIAVIVGACLTLTPIQGVLADEGRSEPSPTAIPQLSAKSYTDQLRFDPQNADLWRRLAAAEAREGNLSAAEAAISQAISLAPEDRDIQLARANILMWRGKLAEAGNQAKAVRLADPTYLGLAAFDQSYSRALNEAQKFDLLSVSLSASVAPVQFGNGANQTWESTAIGIAFGNPGRTVFAVDVDAERRTTTDVRLLIRATTRTKTGSYYIGAGLAPQATFRDQWRIAGGATLKLVPRVQAELNARFAHYNEGLTSAFEPGLSVRLNHKIWLSGKMINLFDARKDYRIGGAFRADYEPEEDLSLFASIARYPDREEDGVRQLDSIALGARVNLGAHWQWRATAADENRKNSYRRQLVNLSVAYRFTSP